MKKKDSIEVDGVVTECFKAGKFEIKLDTGQTVFAYLSGRMKRHKIRVLLGDKVKIELSPYDMTLGRITFRTK